MWASRTASDTGVLSYQANLRPTRILFWFDRSGKQIGSVGEHAILEGGARISPDGRRAAVQLWDRESRAGSIWITDLSRGVETRLTQDVSAFEGWPVWSPDSSRIAFVTARGGPNNFYIRSASGTGDDQALQKFKASSYVNRPWATRSTGRARGRVGKG